ncbi:MAG: thio(seleno)oxazole modification radical SAM maturase SbtM [Syntrophobacteraceae bacterium]
MSRLETSTLNTKLPVSRSHAEPRAWDRLLEGHAAAGDLENLSGLVQRCASEPGLPPFLPDLVRLEWALHEVRSADLKSSPSTHEMRLNPSLHLIRCSWQGLAGLLRPAPDDSGGEPVPGEELVLVLKHPKDGELVVRPALPEDLLALKIVVESIDLRQAAAENKVSVYGLEASLDRAVRRGLLIQPPSGIRREAMASGNTISLEGHPASASVFTLQWHITQACDLRCRHCYDRSQIGALELPKAMAVLDDLHAFCRSRQVRGQVSFSGGNPFLHPHFEELYAAAAERGFNVAILGNPVPRHRIEALMAIDQPVFYQVSLEGLRDHNDWVRGEGHFDRVLELLDVLRDLGIYSMVMLTLTRDNMGQVIPLAELLRDKADLFTFNRLSRVGEGASLQLPSRNDYRAFLESYYAAAAHNPVIALKDNLINVMLHQKGLELFGGCTGYGCGAAFNFTAVLPDGEVHACRKLPSPIGHLRHATLGEIYESDAANAYRAGCRACDGCTIRPVCGGCLAVSYGAGKNPLEEKDPYCYLGE